MAHDDTDGLAIGRLIGVLAVLLAVSGGMVWVVAGFFREAPVVQQDVVVSLPSAPVLKPRELTVREKQIISAINLGANHLKHRLLGRAPLYGAPAMERGGFNESDGAAALAGLALLEVGVPASDPSIQRALQIVRAKGPTTTMIYSLGAMLFFLNRLHESAPLAAGDVELLRALALRVIAGQREDGRWTYNNPVLQPKEAGELFKKLRERTYTPARKQSNVPTTHSMTQFAILSLWGTRKHGIPTRQPILHAAARFGHNQYPDGSWDYNIDFGNGKILHDSNTCAGLLALAMDKTLREDKELQDPSSFDPPVNMKARMQRDMAFAHITKVIGKTGREPITIPHEYYGTLIRADAWGDFYFLWCLERVAVIYGLENIGGKDWYAWGSDVILRAQKGNGSWVDRHGDVPDTCFALLFLAKANLAKDLTDKLRDLLQLHTAAVSVQPAVPGKQ